MTTELRFPATRCLFGTATRDVTPPVGIYSRSWGAAAHDTGEGVHRPFVATAALFAPIGAEGAPAGVLALVAVDIGWFQNLSDERAVRADVMRRTGIPESALLINMSHTHAGANANGMLADVPGAELVKPYLAHLTAQIGDAILEARGRMLPAWIAYAYGRCALANNRDYFDAVQQRYACGFNPDVPADDTLLVARVTGDDGSVLATLFNYACHPTTLAWQNRLLSPDFVAAAREVLERAFGAPALFLQGSLGELAPRDNYVGEAGTADRNGRQLGHAAAAAIEGLPHAGSRFVYTGIVPSGADLGTWAWQPSEANDIAAAQLLSAHMSDVPLARKQLPSLDELAERLAATADRREQEIIRRRIFIQLTLGESETHVMPLWTWRLGQAALVAIPNEPYTLFQLSLRRRFAGVPLFVLGVTNGTLGYLAPRDSYGKGIYQEQQSPYAPGALEQTISAAGDALQALFPGTGLMHDDGLDAIVRSHLGRTFPAAVVVVRQAGVEVFARALGWLDPETRTQFARLDTRFDLASVTKLFAATAFMTCVDEGLVSLDQPVCELLPEFRGERPLAPYPDPLAPGQFVTVEPPGGRTADAARVTFRHLLSHQSGLPAWLPLYREGSRARAYEVALQTSFAYPIGAHSVYSDIGLILLGLALERLCGRRLDTIVRERVTAPLGLASISYNPVERSNIAPTEFCAWRQRRIVGEVHDENAAGLDGVSAHAGLFAAARDLSNFGEIFLRGGAPLLQPATVRAMTQVQAQEGAVRRGLGFALWSPDPEASGNPFSPDAFGHTGFTGTALWIDPRRELVAVSLTNRVYYGRANADATGAFRVALHTAIAAQWPPR